jgi:cyclophilin family peptidyl-prolyl cis-trans isomerase
VNSQGNGRKRTPRTGACRGRIGTSLRLEELEPRIAPTIDLFMVPGDPGTATDIRVDFLARDSRITSEVGVFAVDDDMGSIDGMMPGDDGYEAAALGRAQVALLLGTRPGDRLNLGFDGGTLLAIYLVPGSTTMQATLGNSEVLFSVDGANLDEMDHVLARDRGDGGVNFFIEDTVGLGDHDYNDAVISVSNTRGITTPGSQGQLVQAEFTRTSSESGLRHEIGLFALDGPDGRVGDLLPGDPGYAVAALSSASRQTIFNASRPALGQQTLTLPSDQLFGFYLVTSGTTEQFLAANPTNTRAGGPLAYFTFPEANPDGLDHTRWQSENELAWEDLFGGGDLDFNDIAFTFTFGIPSGSPGTPPPGGAVPGDTTPPTVSIQLVNDTGISDSDGITSQVQFQVAVTDESSVQSVRAGFDDQDPATFTDLTAQFDTAGNLIVDDTLITQINGGPLSDGAHTLLLEVVDFASNGDTVPFDFTLDTTPPELDYNLRAADDTGPVGDFRTDLSMVQLVGTTEVDATVMRLSDNTTITAPAGTFRFDVTLDVGPNNFSLQSTDLAGNMSTLNRVIVRNEAPTVDAGIADQMLNANDPATTIELSNAFADAETFVRFSTALGDIDAQLFENETPQTVDNFFNYVNNNDYANTLFHRLVPGFVLQGGGFQFIAGTPPQIIDVPADAPVVNEPGITNAEGTIALAKLGGDPDSGTNEFFFNLADNSQNLDNQNGGFTVFGQVASGQDVIDQFEGFTVSDQSSFNGAFGSLPVQPTADTSNFPANITANDLALLLSATELANGGLTFSVVDNTNASVVVASITDTVLTLTPQSQTGTAQITLRATDHDQATVDLTFTVTVI